jgi:GT2 family glycosyltransferase
LVHGLGQPTRYSPTESPGAYLGDPREAFPYYIGAGLYRRRVFQSVGLFDTSLQYGEDHDWFLRARESGARIVHLDDVTLFVRRHEGNMTRGKSLVELNALRVFKKMLDRHRQAPMAAPVDPA